jgi:hypothetical protein
MSTATDGTAELEWEHYSGPTETWSGRTAEPTPVVIIQRAHQCEKCVRSFDRPSSLIQVGAYADWRQLPTSECLYGL